MTAAVTIQQGSATREGRLASSSLEFTLARGRTGIARQFVPYPFHITRPFHLDERWPELSTLYLQSASGGLYRGDRLGLSIKAGMGAAAHITTQAATMVHDTHSTTAEQVTRIEAKAGAMVAFTPDPLILFPGANYRGTTEVVRAEDSIVICTESASWHDPYGRDRMFAAFFQTITIGNERGALLASERAEFRGSDLRGESSPIGPFGAFGTLLAICPPARIPDSAFDASRVCSRSVSATTKLPNGAGFAIRLLAPGGGALARCLDAAFRWAFTRILGFPLAPRRK